MATGPLMDYDDDIYKFTPDNYIPEAGCGPKWDYVRCKQNPWHKHFKKTPLTTVDELPEGHRKEENMAILQQYIDRTVRVRVRAISKDRPDVFPDTNEEYPSHFNRGGSGKDLCWGTGFLFPGKSNGTSHTAYVLKARHVVYDDYEARNSQFDLNYEDAVSTDKVVTMFGEGMDENGGGGDDGDGVCVAVGGDGVDGSGSGSGSGNRVDGGGDGADNEYGDSGNEEIGCGSGSDGVNVLAQDNRSGVGGDSDTYSNDGGSIDDDMNSAIASVAGCSVVPNTDSGSSAHGNTNGGGDNDGNLELKTLKAKGPVPNPARDQMDAMRRALVNEFLGETESIGAQQADEGNNWDLFGNRLDTLSDEEFERQLNMIGVIGTLAALGSGEAKAFIDIIQKRLQLLEEQDLIKRGAVTGGKDAEGCSGGDSGVRNNGDSRDSISGKVDRGEDGIGNCNTVGDHNNKGDDANTSRDAAAIAPNREVGIDEDGNHRDAEEVDSASIIFQTNESILGFIQNYAVDAYSKFKASMASDFSTAQDIMLGCVKLEAVTAAIFPNDQSLHNAIRSFGRKILTCTVFLSTTEYFWADMMRGDFKSAIDFIRGQFIVEKLYPYAKGRKDGWDDYNTNHEDDSHLVNKQLSDVIHAARGRLDQYMNKDRYMFLYLLMPLMLSDNWRKESPKLQDAMTEYWRYFKMEDLGFGTFSDVLQDASSDLGAILNKYHQLFDVNRKSFKYLATYEGATIDLFDQMIYTFEHEPDDKLRKYMTDRVLVRCVVKDDKLISLLEDMPFSPTPLPFDAIVSHPHGYFKRVTFGTLASHSIYSHNHYFYKIGTETKFKLCSNANESDEQESTMTDFLQFILGEVTSQPCGEITPEREREIEKCKAAIQSGKEIPLKRETTLAFPKAPFLEDGYRALESNTWVRFPSSAVYLYDEKTYAWRSLPIGLSFYSNRSAEEVFESLTLERTSCCTHDIPTCPGSSGALLRFGDHWHIHSARRGNLKDDITYKSYVGITSIIGQKKQPGKSKGREVAEALNIHPMTLVGARRLKYYIGPE